MQEPRKIDRDATTAAVRHEYGSVKAFCSEAGPISAQLFYYVLQGAGQSWGRSASRTIYERLQSEGLLVFESTEREVCHG